MALQPGALTSDSTPTPQLGKSRLATLLEEARGGEAEVRRSFGAKETQAKPNVSAKARLEAKARLSAPPLGSRTTKPLP